MGAFYRAHVWHGQELWLKYNFDAMKSLNERYPDMDYVREIASHSADQQTLVCAVAEELIRQGEALRLHFGYPRRRYPSAKELQMISSPTEYMALVIDVLEELTHKHDGDSEESEWEDPWLEEVQKKTNFLASQSGSRLA